MLYARWRFLLSMVWILLLAACTQSEHGQLSKHELSSNENIAGNETAATSVVGGDNSNVVQGSNGSITYRNSGNMSGIFDQRLIVPGELIVKFKKPTTRASVMNTLNHLSVRSVQEYEKIPGLRRVRLAPGVDVQEAIATYTKQPNVEYAEPNFRVSKSSIPNDPEFSNQWGLNNVGQTSEVAVTDADIDAPEAWDITTGDSNIVIAVLDTGVDYSHLDLQANIFRNSGDCNSDGIDDDGDGYVDDCYGIDTVNGDSDPMDDNGHGTHVAGIIGADGDNGVGVSGVAWHVKILPCKFLDATGNGTVADAVACLDYVAAMKDRGVNIIATNNSWGGLPYSRALADAISAQTQRGILFVTASGNDGADHDQAQIYPCNYDSPNILCVGAFTEADVLANFSDRGAHTVHIAAPGFDVLSTLPGNSYGKLTGTSMAAPHVAGVAALLKSNNPLLDWRSIKNLIIAGGKPRAYMKASISKRILSAYGSLTCSDSPVTARLQPRGSFVPMKPAGSPVIIRMLNINCADPAGELTVSVSPSGRVLQLKDDGISPDIAAGDGIYSASWTENTSGTFTLNFPNNETVDVVFDMDLQPGFPVQTYSFGGVFTGGARILTLVGNIDDDPELEILRTGLAVGPLYAWKADGSTVPGWPRTVTDATGTYLDAEGVSYPLLGNFAGAADKLEIFANNYGWTKAVYDGHGQILPGWPLSTNSANPGAAYDIDGDGIDEIFTDDNDATSATWLVAHRADGSVLPGWPVTIPPHSGASYPRSPVIADLDGDGKVEIITVDNDAVVAYHLDGTMVDGFPTEIPTGVLSSLAVGDVDGDGNPEIILASMTFDSVRQTMIYLVGSAGGVKRVIYGTFETARSTESAPALADMDGDGIPEIVYQSDLDGQTSGGLEVWKGDGTMLPGWPVSLNMWRGNSAPVVGDLDGDGSPDIAITGQLPGNSDGAEVYAYDAKGVSLPQFPKKVEVGSGATPAIADIDLDGRNELIITGSYWNGYSGAYDTVWVFDLGGPTPHGPIEWGQYQNDARHSGYYETGKNLSGFAFLTAHTKGAGAIRSVLPGIDCGADCIERYPNGTSVTLTAIPAPGATFLRWQGACEGQTNPCTVAVTKYMSAFADFTDFQYKLTVSNKDPRLGTVVSNTGGISCPNYCSEIVPAGDTVTLTANPVSNAVFTGWSGACTGTSMTCDVAMDMAKNVSASFAAKVSLTVSNSFPGSNRVTSVPGGIDCGIDCSEDFAPSTVVTLNAIPGSDSVIVGWTGDCSGSSDSCTVVMDKAKYVGVTFALKPRLSVSTNGDGMVTSVPSGISCGVDCEEVYLQSTLVTLSATPSGDAVFSGWAGDCSGANGVCVLTVDDSKNVTATFLFKPMLSVVVLGGGSVTSAPDGIDCGVNCSKSFLPGSSVELDAIANPGYVFEGWQGGCTGSTNSCSLIMDSAKSVSAVFASSGSSSSSNSSSMASSANGANSSSSSSAAGSSGSSSLSNASAQTKISNSGGGGKLDLSWILILLVLSYARIKLSVR